VTRQAPPAVFHCEEHLTAKHIFSFPVAVSALVAVTVFAIARKGIADPDIWWHLRNAHELLRGSGWPRADTYSYTAYGHPWINPEWLSEIPYYLVWRVFGLVGMKALSLFILEAIFAGLLYLSYCKSGNIKAAAVAAYLAILLGSVSFGPRTILFGYLFLIALLILLEHYRSSGSAPLWLLPSLFCLWANSHGSWALGLVVFVIFVISGLVEGHWGNLQAVRWSKRQFSQLGAAFVASVGAVFVNPYGYRLALYPLDMAFHQKLNIAHVVEWNSVDFHQVRGKIVFVLLLVLLVAALMRQQRWHLCEFGFVAFGLYCGLTYVRFLFLAGLLTAPVIAQSMCFIPRYRSELDRPVVNAMLITGALAFVFWTFPTMAQLSQSVESEYPREALSQLASIGTSDRVLNYYLWGGYIGWQNPQFRDFIDSRVDVFEYAGVLQDYLDLLALKEPFRILDKYRIRYVLFPPDELLTYALEHDPRWKVIFRGKISVLFHRIEDDRAVLGTIPLDKPNCSPYAYDAAESK
jgi:hypothetical protein